MRRPRTFVLGDGRGRRRAGRLGRSRALDVRAAPAGHGHAAAVVPHVRTAGARAGRERRQPRRPARRASTAPTPPPSCARPVRASSSSSTTSPTARTGCTSRRIRRACSATASTTTFTINVDTHKPTLVLNRVPPGWRPITEISGRVEPGSKLALSYEGRRVVVKPSSGAFALDPDLPDGRTTVRLIASDRAGNRSVITRTMAVDGTPPRLHLDQRAGARRHGAPDAARLARRRLARDGAGEARRRLGRAARARRQGAARRGRRQGPLLAAAGPARPGRPPALDHRDRLGRQHVHGRGRPVHGRLDREAALLDVLAIGARGADVVQLERRLKAFGVYKGPFTRFYNARTEAAVRRLPGASTTCPSPASRRRSCCSSAPSASSCTSTASAST